MSTSTDLEPKQLLIDTLKELFWIHAKGSDGNDDELISNVNDCDSIQIQSSTNVAERLMKFAEQEGIYSDMADVSV